MNQSVYGVHLYGGTSVISTAAGITAGSVTISGSGGTGTFNNHGVLLQGTTTDVSSVDGNISISGIGAGSGGNNWGVLLSGVETIRSTGMGSITIHGTGANGMIQNYGVHLSGATTDVTTLNGQISIAGQGGIGSGGSGSGGGNHGVFGSSIEQIASLGSGDISIVGTGGSNAAVGAQNVGVFLAGSTTNVRTIDGNIAITGTGGSSLDGANIGVNLLNIEKIEATGIGALMIDGTGGDGRRTNYGVSAQLISGGRLKVHDGDLSITGTAGNGVFDNNRGIYLGLTTIESSGAGDIQIVGAGGVGSANNSGVFLNGANVSSAISDISISGTGGGNGFFNSNEGVVFRFNAFAKVTSGNLTVDGNAGLGHSGGISMVDSGGGSLIANGPGMIEVTGRGNLTGIDLNMDGNSVIGGATASGPILIVVDTLTLTGASQIRSTGPATISPRTTGTTIGLGGGSGILNLDGTELDRFHVSSLTIGDSAAGRVTFSAPVDLANSNTLEIITGGDITQSFVGTAFTIDTLIVKGQLAPGLTTAGTFNADGNITFDTTATYAVNLNGGVSYDQLVVVGNSHTTTLGGAKLELTLNMAPATGSQQVFRIVDSTGTGSAISGVLSYLGTPLNDGDTFTVGSTIFRINYNPAGASGDVILTEAGNTAPQANAGGPYFTEEGTPLVLNGTGTTDNETANAGLTFEWDLDYDGVTFDVDTIGEQPVVSFPDNFASRDIAVRVTDPSGASDISVSTLGVTNVAPTASFVGAGMITYGQTETVSFSLQYDESSIDTAAGFHYAYSLIPDFTGITYASGSSTLPSYDFTGLNAGDYIVYARIIDKDNDFSQYSANVTVAKAATLTTVIVAGAPFTYTGAAQTPATVTVTGVGGLSLTPIASYVNNTNAGTATASYSYVGDDNHLGSSDSEDFTIDKAATLTTVTIVGAPFTYTGSAQTPATVTVTGAGGLSLTPTASYVNNTNAGTATASYSYAGDANHLASSDSEDFTIDKAATLTTVTIVGAPFTYTGSAQTPATVTVTGAGGLSLTPAAIYVNNTNAGTATASYSYIGDDNHLGSSDSEDFTIDKAASFTTVTIAGGPFTYTGLAQTPATATVTGAGGLSLTPTASYVNNTNAGTATASYSYAGDDNHLGSSDSEDFTINKANAVVTVNGYTGTYDAAAHGATGSVTGVAVDSSAVGSSLDLGASFTNAPGGTANWTFSGGINYNDQSGTADIVINKANAVVTVNGYTGTYDAEAHGATGSVVGVAGDLSAVGSSLDLGASFTNAPGGTASWTFSGGMNYNDQNGTADIVINKANAVVTVNGYAGIYDAAAHGATGSVTDVAGDSSAVGSSLDLGASFTNAPGGTANWAFSGGINYNDQSGMADIVINKATQTISWLTPAAINYGTPLSGTQLNASVTGVSGGSDPGELTYSPSAGTVLQSGSRTLWVTAAETVNYLQGSGSVTLIVNRYTSNGFLQPISLNRAFKQGSTVPIKWQVKDASGNVLTNLSSITSLTVTGPSDTTTLYAGNLNSSGATVLRNDGGQYIFNWQTKGFDLGSYRIMALLADGTSVTQTIMLSKTGGAAGLVIDGVTGTAAVGTLLAGDLTLYIDNNDGGFSSYELDRIEEAILGIELLISPYGTKIFVVDGSVGLDANIVLASGTTNVLGGLGDGILGVATSEGQITIIDGWNWYAGNDATAIGSGQYDFQTVITHEIAHSLGLGHSENSVSVMFPELATADARRTLLFADLSTAGEEGGAGLHVEALFAAGHNQSVEETANQSPPFSSSSKHKLAGMTGPASATTSLRSGISELLSDESLNVQMASDSKGADLNNGFRRPTKEGGWRDVFKSGKVDTPTDIQGIDSFFSGLADDSSILDILANTVANELWNEMAF